MNLDEFLHNLHFAIDKVSPPDWEVDWKDAPLPYKIYRGLPFFSLSLEVPLSLEEWEAPAASDLRKIGHFLWYVYGITQFAETKASFAATENEEDVNYSYRRFAPSGGALYPNELYIYLHIENVPAGVYHYDAAHHRLVLVREGHFDSYIERALGHRCEVSACFATVFVSTMFWKNFYKYNNFAYRLQGLDAGVLIGQLLETAKRFGFASGVYFQFLDRAINHLLGLSETEESVYAMIPLSVEATNWVSQKSRDRMDSAAGLCQQLPPIHNEHFVKSHKIHKFPLLIKMNEAAMLDTVDGLKQMETREKTIGMASVIKLPYVERMSYDLAEACRRRYSPGMDFILGKVNLVQLAALLQEAAASFNYRNDLDEKHRKREPRVSLYGCFHNIEGIPDGAYHYDGDKHVLQQIRLGDHRFRLQSGLSVGNVNLFQVPLCFHVAGDNNHYKEKLGFRGYRIQQMEAGMLVQRLLLAASALGLGGHPLLGFDVKVCDELYQMEEAGETSLIQIPIGHFRERAWLKGRIQT
ncbi:SagB family peptide dehydrogenase [Bacillus benzoevorans]|uniref:SagB-type dehydrogenase family enzyme n=1 Tax=Bacillus benzoevorans TaxID=1456 RepID=A0A7X0HR16_9BACI|nr:SagB family peptide dehydrogenase [Bacillus benzoevorans]MBB6445324.1 SagB-type dehydrogenase family enzyme [Bacillus benzoevorans]